ncbi:MAG: hypothetical protein CL572_06745 [Alphaproteobacteria bacterium]|nr:hypothetical protein [Alphaproteobacteria bacterium]
MNSFFKIKNNKFFFYSNKKQIFVEKDKPLYVYKQFHANNILDEINLKKKDQYSLINLTYFSCALDSNDKKKIIEILIEVLKNDFVLFRYFDDKNLLDLMSNKLDFYVNEFSIKFNIKLNLINSLKFNYQNSDTQNFKTFLFDLNIFLLSCIYKLTCLTKSVILSYFFIIKKINYKQLFELTSIESKFQQKNWGYVDEQKKIDLDNINILKNISFFFKNIN